MELLAVARTLWRRRVLIAAGALVAALAAILTTHSIVSLLPPKLASRQQVVGVAQSRLFVDTARSQITGATAPGADTIVTRASLAANLLTSPDAHRALARDAGVPVGSFEVIGPAAVTPTVNTELAQRTSLAAAAPRAPYALAIETDSVLPIVAIHVTGPDAGPARRLARAVDDRLPSALAKT